MRNSWFKFFGLVIAIAIAIISCHSLTLPKASTAVTVKLSGWGGNPVEQKLLQQVLKDFEAQHPKIKVKYEVISDQYMDVIKTRLVGEAAPDVFYLDALEAPFFMSQNVLEPLNAYITPEFDLADFEPNLLNSFKYQNQIYGFPKDYSTLSLFYNKKAFAEAGLSNSPTTWEELRSYSEKLTGKLNKYGFGEIPELARQAYKIKAFGGQIINQNDYATFASEPGLQGLQLVIDQYQKDRSSAQKSDVGTNSGSEMFGQSKVAMVIEGNWAIPYLQETFPQLEFATAEIPTINGKNNTMVFTVAYVMNKQAKHKAEAWELIAYLTGKQGMQKWTGTGFALPTRKSVAEKLGYDQDPLRSPFVSGVSYATPWQAGKYPAAIVNNFDNQFISALLGQQPLKQAMVRAQTAANQQIQAME
ncbi:MULTISPECIES: ABC transporter substrate-binding protein [unclassified Tolypothrix]|uniref:ABC transporter substrate-binding protein n=1 Tax=unclassified Tolypothrix TaxID=2649714 RepID=UPI0005EABDF0|nr:MULTISPECIES: ABC transporter substrate-binding protein [unclassified Tolypothrix]BAY94841.1 sugar transport system, sugar-binding protein [Microchaete diplosiphon NIES-3275]EKF04261.1 bacterial extracellular solute-binding protein [Tolypothrix sp. PCC 7601]MBE9086310.1 ABC transporter substrate-binding protein [Tolypothrix sp. LEGE 11397]UYD28492.1 ABC transporter substrate-binding protein [Tolypothrix sp. PCC 7712]UYD35596.1 ABC transporter substrate-binding protein [Tolypothrix sp. PCC 7